MVTFNEQDYYDKSGKNIFDGSYNKNFDTTSGKVVGKTKDLKKGSVSKWLKKVDGQDSSGKGGGKLAAAAGVIDKFQGYRDAAKWKGDSTPNTIREGASKTELAQGDEIGNYDAWLKRQNKEKKKNSNYA